MVVVAIIAILAALSAYTLSSVNEIGRINGAAQMVANVLRNARTRAITERCTYVVQINGRNYNPVPAAADVLRQPGSIIVWRKNNCRSNVGAYVGGLPPDQRDRRVEDYAMQEFNVSIFLPAAVLTEPGNRLNIGSFSVGWQPDGTRMIWSDSNGDGTSDDTMFAGALTIAVRTFTGELTPMRPVNVPVDGPAVAP
jgi:hypothetical protein